MIDLYALTPRSLVEGLRRRLKKSLGQNFLIDENVTRAIAAQVDRFHPGHILEVGPGAGALTLALATLQKPLAVIEKDDDCARYVDRIFSGNIADFSVIHGDALAAPLPDFCSQREARTVLASNLPYNVASQIYFRFIDADLPLAGMVLMFQREVALRFTASPATSSYGLLSVLGQYYHDIERVVDVGPQAFVPMPKVESAVLAFFPRKRELPKDAEPAFRAFVRAAFALRRKTLANSLAGYAKKTKAEWQTLVADLGFEPNCRAESLAKADFLRIFRAIDV